MGLLDLILSVKLLFAVHLKYSSFCPSAGVTPVTNDPVHAVPKYVHVFCLHVSIMLHHWPGVTHVYNGKESLGIATWQHISQLSQFLYI
jgi:hypothetical protein